MAQPPANNLAIASLIVGVAGLAFCAGVPGPIALILGLRARKQIRDSGGAQSGDILAIIGAILGGIGTVLVLAYVVFFVIWLLFVIGLFAAAGTSR